MAHNVFRPIPGDSIPEQINRLYRSVNGMAAEFQRAMDRANGLISQAETRSIYNGAYWDKSVTFEEGWDSENGTAFHIVRIPNRDKRRNRINIRVRPAFNNATNSQVVERISDASAQTLADHIWTASRGDNPNGWEGIVTIDGSEANSEDIPSGFTVGFTANRVMHWYRNTTDRRQLRRDRIQNSMGVAGVIVNNNQPSPELFGDDNNTRRARVSMGFNRQTKEVILLIVGDYDLTHNIVNGKDYGMGVNAAARILSSYGADIAVTTALGGSNNGASAIRRGEFVVMPADDNPRNQAFWFISRAQDFQNDFTYDMADLRQRYGYLRWLLERLRRQVQVLEGRVDNHETRINVLEVTVTNLGNALNNLEIIVNNLGTEMDDLSGRLEIAEGNITTLQTNVTNIQTSLTTVQNALNAEIARSVNQDNLLWDALNNLEQQVGAAGLRGRFKGHFQTAPPTSNVGLDAVVTDWAFVDVDSDTTAMYWVVNVVGDVLTWERVLTLDSGSTVSLPGRVVGSGSAAPVTITGQQGGDWFIQHTTDVVTLHRATGATGWSAIVNIPTVARVDALAALITALTTRVTNLEGRMTVVENRVTNVEGDITNIFNIIGGGEPTDPIRSNRVARATASSASEWVTLDGLSIRLVNDTWGYDMRSNQGGVYWAALMRGVSFMRNRANASGRADWVGSVANPNSNLSQSMTAGMVVEARTNQNLTNELDSGSSTVQYNFILSVGRRGQGWNATEWDEVYKVTIESTFRTTGGGYVEIVRLA